MSRYIGKRVHYECGFCKKQFTLNKQSVDDSEKSGEVFCSKQCSEQFYLSDVSVSLTDAEIITWLRKQNYQTEMGEQEYIMYFDVDMPKIIRAAIVHFSSGNKR